MTLKADFSAAFDDILEAFSEWKRTIVVVERVVEGYDFAARAAYGTEDTVTVEGVVVGVSDDNRQLAPDAERTVYVKSGLFTAGPATRLTFDSKEWVVENYRDNEVTVRLLVKEAPCTPQQ